MAARHGITNVESSGRGLLTMIRYQCEVCDRLKRPEESWVLGFAAERLGVTEARREITLVAKWDGERALRPFAVHFCSERCKVVYMEKMFGDTMPEIAPLARKNHTRPAARKRVRRSKAA